MEFEESLEVERLREGVRETYATLSRFHVGPDEVSHPWGPLGVLLHNAVIKAKLDAADLTDGEPLHLRFGFGGGRADSQCSERLHLACLRLKEVFVKWFSPSLSRDVLHFHAKQREEEEEEGAVLLVDAWLGQEDLPITSEALAAYLSISYPLGKDLGLASVLHHDDKGEKQQQQQLLKSSFKVHISLTTQTSGGDGDASQNESAEIAEVRTSLQVEREDESHLPSSQQNLEEFAEDWKRSIEQKMTARCSACTRSVLLVKSFDGSQNHLEMDLKTAAELGDERSDQRESKAKRNSENRQQHQSQGSEGFRVKRYLTGHPSSLHVVQNYELAFDPAEDGMLVCLVHYVPSYLSPIFSSSIVQKLVLAGGENENEIVDIQASPLGVAESGDTRGHAWRLTELHPSIDYIPCSSSSSSSNAMEAQANFMKICLDLTLLSSNSTTNGVDSSKDRSEEDEVKTNTTKPKEEEEEEAFKVSLAFRKSFPSVFGLPADRSAGLYLPVSYAYSAAKHSGGGNVAPGDMASLFHGGGDGGAKIHLLPSQRVLYPLPDASMPYNACIITCTLFALYVGVMLKSLKYIPKAKQPQERQRVILKKVKTLVNVLVMLVLAGVVWWTDSETRFKISQLFV